MADHNLLGASGEEAAARYLAARDYHLLARNWRCGHLELDLVADYYGEVVFFEVKTRRNGDFGDGLEAVDAEKQRRLLRAAQAFLNYYHLDQPFRFDVLALAGTAPGNFRITHYERAFDWHSVHGASRGYFR